MHFIIADQPDLRITIHNLRIPSWILTRVSTSVRAAFLRPLTVIIAFAMLNTNSNHFNPRRTGARLVHTNWWTQASSELLASVLGAWSGKALF